MDFNSKVAGNNEPALTVRDAARYRALLLAKRDELLAAVAESERKRRTETLATVVEAEVAGTIFARDRPRLHVATLVYGMIVEIFGFWCLLTALETWLEVRGNLPAYRGAFLLH